MSAVVLTSPIPVKIAETITATRETCAALQDTLDGWIKAGAGLDTVACWWIAESGQSKGATKRLRKSKAGTAPQGLRKRCVAFLEGQFATTGFTAKEINKALQLFALEKSAPWIAQLKSEAKARELKSLATWHWEGCKLTREGDRSIKAVKQALADGGMAQMTVKDIREVVSGIIGRVKAKKNSARAAAKAFFDAIEGTDDREACDRADILGWLAVLLTESPLAAEVLTTAVEAHLDGLQASEGKVGRAA
jgi:hypothetical protein